MCMCVCVKSKCKPLNLFSVACMCILFRTDHVVLEAFSYGRLFLPSSAVINYLISNYYQLNFYFMCMSLCTMCVPDALGAQKKVSDSMDLEF